jgi:hypothetical protein
VWRLAVGHFQDRRTTFPHIRTQIMISMLDQRPAFIVREFYRSLVHGDTSFSENYSTAPPFKN